MKYTVLVIAMLITKTVTAEPLLSWETKNSKNIEWTKITLETAERYFSKLDKVEDMEQFCPQYKNLDKEKKILVWGELISAMAFYESGWRTNVELTEISLGTDSVTGMVVASQGLLQLSYGDTKWAKWCDFDWEADKKNPEDPTILRAKNNLECGIGILANQVNKHKQITLSGKHAYWSVLKKDSKWKKIDGIAKMVKKLPYCN
jgi:hypothetical protein